MKIESLPATGRGTLQLDGSPMTLVREQGIHAVPHGFRSSFRDWCGETGQPRDVAEACLAHAVTSKVEAAYARSDLLNRRRTLMQAWADYLSETAHQRAPSEINTSVSA